MTTLDRPHGVRIHGQPVPQGSMTCVGRGGFHNVQPSNRKELGYWRRKVVEGGQHLLGKVGGTLVGPIGVEVTFTVPRPASVPPAQRPWPFRKGGGTGDVDKLARAVLDGLTDARLIADDAQVVELVARKVYPDTPDAIDVLTQPGAVIRIHPIQ